MFDPERDDDGGHRRFYLRLIAVLWVTAAACASLLPSVTAFSTGPDRDRSCLAIVDGWHADHSPTAADRAASEGFVGSRPSPAQQAAIERAAPHYDWLFGPGACVPESRHRLILTGIGLGSLAAGVGVTYVVRAARRRRREPEPGPEPDPAPTPVYV